MRKKISSFRTWNITRDGYTFNCSYDNKNDWVEVVCYGLDCGSKNAKAGASGADVIAWLLAGGIISVNKKQ
ncbi:MAG: hypothetical protein CVV42_17315 [Candidatus Riflebacteria bacterium HGW-Riflebacteria-2]|jgi:hypothetical protein|nr:MAG: hypothetical protein CVV42_17315 [Candidatus Riflebacteria bacterium HGW-Riflebacteria-2]